MTATVTDLFCGAGGSSLGAEAAGMKLSMAANHWDVAIEVHQAHFPDAGHDLADISQADPRRYPVTNVLLASPECTNHSQARGVSRRQQDPSTWDAPDPGAERSRATMWCVVRFAEQITYDAIVVENVVEVVQWAFWKQWLSAMTDVLGYDYRILSHNSMHHQVAQSRDRVYIVFTRPGLNVDLEMEQTAPCPVCQGTTIARQTWKPKALSREFLVGRYRQQWTWNCTSCNAVVEPATRGAREIIDWSLDCPRIGDRAKPLAENTRKRIAAGLERYGWLHPITTTGAGNTHERTPGNRARTVDEPLPVQQTTATSALATPPEGLIVRNYGNVGGDPGRHVTPVSEPVRTMTTQPGQALIVPNNMHNVPRSADEPTPLCTTGNRNALVVPMRNNGHSHEVTEPLGAVTAGGNHHGLLMRNNPGGAEMVTPVTEPARTLTTKGHQSLLVPYNRTGVARSVDEPAPTLLTKDTAALVNVDAIVDDCGFRMLEPHEVAAAMAFPDGYIPHTFTKRDRVKLAGNAVTPPVMQWICGRILRALEGS